MGRDSPDGQKFIRLLGPTDWLGLNADYSVNPLTDSIGTTATQLLAADTNRIYWILVNLGDYPAWIGFANDVSATKGLPLDSGGGTARCHIGTHGKIATAPLWAIALDGAAECYLVEVHLT